MGKQSNLGPIDPQFNGVPAHAILEEFNTIMADVKADPSRIIVWREILQKYTPTLIGECDKAIKWSKNIVADWLKENMFKKESRFKNHDEVMEYLNETYYQGKVNNYEIKSMWKGNTLQYVTEFHTGVMEDKVWYIVTIYDNDLNKRKVFAETDCEIVWKDAYDFVEGL